MGKLWRSIGTTTGAVALAGTTMVVLPSGTAAAYAEDCGPAADACLDLSAGVAWLMHDDAITYGGVPMTSGRPGYETPPGTFQVTYKDIDHWSEAWDAPMPYSVFFTESGIAFHEGSLSDWSHGCIHLSPEAARMFFDTLQPGDVVQVIP